MKKILNLTLTIMLLLGLLGCAQPDSPENVKFQEEETTGASEVTKSPETTAQETVPAEMSHPAESSEETAPMQWVGATEATVETEPTEPTVTAPTQPESESTNPPTTLPAETKPPETEPPATEPLESETPTTEPTELPATEPMPNPTEAPAETTEAPTEPPCTESTEPLQTGPAGCQHTRICIHHNEEGHWKAGVVCDCGWIVYGDPEELPSLWNAHSASYPAAESLFEHGGYGCMDEWIVDEPAYDDWICQYCGEPKT